MESNLLRRSVSLLLLPALANTAFAAESSSASGQTGQIEEVIVTAQRQAESIQDVPIAVTALSGQMMEDKQIIGVSDLQMNAPNVSFTPTNFGGNNFSIRGIGRLVISTSGESGVSTHINEIPVTTNLTAIEFYDVERVEVLRGPQGTLFGRNATGGAVNMVTNMPEFDGVSAFIDGEYGDYDNTRIKGMINVPITDTFAIRAAGMWLKRDGYIKNLAAGQVGTNGETLSNIDNDIDGRDLWSTRITASWDITDNANLWVQYYKFKEDDDKVRIMNQVCETNPVPVQGCLPDGFGFDTPNLMTTTGGLFGGLLGALPLGDPGEGIPGSSIVNYDFPRPEINGFREIHTDFEPVFQDEEDLFTMGFNYAFDQYTFNFLGAYQEREYLSQQDYEMSIGPSFYTTAEGGPLDAYPVSAPAGGAGADWGNGPCNYNDGTAGIFGGCIYPADQSRAFGLDQADAKSDYWTVEARISSQYDGRFNFLLGASAYDAGSSNDYYVNRSGLDLLGLAFGAYPSFFNSTNAPGKDGYQGDGYAVFGEAYFDITPTLKLTAGLRYNEDNKKTLDSVNFLDAYYIPGTTEFSREYLFAAGLSDAWNEPRADLYGASAAFEAAVGTPALSQQRLDAVRMIPVVAQPGERRQLTGSPTKTKFDEITGRLGLDWFVTDDSMVYAFFSRGYKPGGFNPPVDEAFQGDIAFTFGEEKVNAFEIGTKNTLNDGRLQLNAAAFYYDYSGLQITRIAFNSSINDNIDAKSYGLELEGTWNPEAVPGLSLDFAYSYLHTEVDGGKSVDPTNRTASDPDWVALNNIDIGDVTGVNYVAVRDQITPDLIQAAYDAGATFPIPTINYPDGLPGLFSRSFLEANGVETSNGLFTDLDGNSLPNSPENTIHLGAAYQFAVPAIMGSLTLRYDYYWQDSMYAREFNTVGDKIDSWDQHNASVIYDSDDNHWQAKVWIRNIADDDNITGHYLTSDTSGFYRNYFLTEPQIYGASLRYHFF